MKSCPVTFLKAPQLGLLILRLGASSLLFWHGLQKLNTIFYHEIPASFPDPVGLGITPSFTLACTLELICPIMIFFGILTRLFALPLAFMFIIIVYALFPDSGIAGRELPLVYLTMFLTIFFTGAGAYSIDAMIMRKMHGVENG